MGVAIGSAKANHRIVFEGIKPDREKETIAAQLLPPEYPGLSRVHAQHCPIQSACNNGPAIGFSMDKTRACNRAESVAETGG